MVPYVVAFVVNDACLCIRQDVILEAFVYSEKQLVHWSQPNIGNLQAGKHDHRYITSSLELFLRQFC